MHLYNGTMASETADQHLHDFTAKRNESGTLTGLTAVSYSER